MLTIRKKKKKKKNFFLSIIYYNYLSRVIARLKREKVRDDVRFARANDKSRKTGDAVVSNDATKKTGVKMKEKNGVNRLTSVRCCNLLFNS